MKVACTRCGAIWHPVIENWDDKWVCAACDGKVKECDDYALPLEERFQLLRARVETIDAKITAHFARIDKQLDIQECFECGEQISKPGHVVDGKLTCRD